MQSLFQTFDVIPVLAIICIIYVYTLKDSKVEKVF